MTRKFLVPLGLSLAVFALLVVFPQSVLAGPPLICHPFKIGDAKSLPWNEAAQGPKADYEVGRLVGDTLALLTPDAPIIVRMETLRRAMFYAAKHQHVAGELLERLRARALEAEAKGKPNALAAFDFGYLVERYRQAVPMFEHKLIEGTRESASGLANFVAALDGYNWVTKAIRLRGGDPEMEFAAALMTERGGQKGHREHVGKAAAGAKEGSLLARNLASHGFPQTPGVR